MPDRWDLDLVFDRTYLDFYETVLGRERTAAECDHILRLLEPAAQGRLVDLCCGHGRHARELAARGLEVVGVDRSTCSLRRARDGAPPGARFVRADARAVPFEDRCADGAYCWFSSIGYGEPAADLELLQETRRILRLGARIAVESRNWATVAAGEHVLETPIGRIVDRIERDEIHARLRTRRRYEPAGGPPREVEFSLHLYDASAFLALLRDAGFVAVRTLDGDGQPFRGAAPRVVFVGQRPADGA